MSRLLHANSYSSPMVHVWDRGREGRGTSHETIMHSIIMHIHHVATYMYMYLKVLTVVVAPPSQPLWGDCVVLHWDMPAGREEVHVHVPTLPPPAWLHFPTPLVKGVPSGKWKSFLMNITTAMNTSLSPTKYGMYGTSSQNWPSEVYLNNSIVLVILQSITHITLVALFLCTRCMAISKVSEREGPG